MGASGAVGGKILTLDEERWRACPARSGPAVGLAVKEVLRGAKNTSKPSVGWRPIVIFALCLASTVEQTLQHQHGKRTLLRSP